MDTKNIELELRGEVTPDRYEATLTKLHKLGAFHSDTKRLSVMLFGEVGGKKIDIRIRSTNGKCEVVVKTGDFNAHNRVEISQDITPDQFIGMVKVFAQFGFKTKVGPRETLNFSFPNSVLASLVKSGNIAYLELEKMASEETAEGIKAELDNLLEKLEIPPLTNEAFDDLCNRLTNTTDWQFTNTQDNINKLETELTHFI